MTASSSARLPSAWASVLSPHTALVGPTPEKAEWFVVISLRSGIFGLRPELEPLGGQDKCKTKLEFALNTFVEPACQNPHVSCKYTKAVKVGSSLRYGSETTIVGALVTLGDKVYGISACHHVTSAQRRGQSLDPSMPRAW